MRYIINTWGSRPRLRNWIPRLAIVLLLALTLACGQEAPAAAPQTTAVDSGAAEVAAQAREAAEQALAAAQQAQAAESQGDSAEAAAQARAAAEQALVAAEAPRRGEDRPIVSVIGSGSASVSVSASGTGSVSGTGSGTGSGSGSGSGSGPGSVSGTGSGTGSVSGGTAMAGPAEFSGLTIPTGLSYETDRSVPTKSDDYYTPTSHREIYQKISTDYQEIAKLTNAIKEGKPLPAAEIWLLYEVGRHTRLGASSRTLRNFAAGPSGSNYFPDSARVLRVRPFP